MYSGYESCLIYIFNITIWLIYIFNKLSLYGLFYHLLVVPLDEQKFLILIFLPFSFANGVR